MVWRQKVLMKMRVQGLPNPQIPRQRLGTRESIAIRRGFAGDPAPAARRQVPVPYYTKACWQLGKLPHKESRKIFLDLSGIPGIFAIGRK
jgi:hypothetical protein